MGLVDRLRSAFRTGNLNSTQILQSFRARQQELQQKFLRLAEQSGKPRGLRWAGCDWLPSLALVHDSESGLLTLFQGVNLSFEAVEGGDMEDVEAVSIVRDGSAVFHRRDGRWGSGGRVLFNMDPQTAAQVAAAGQTLLAVE